MSNLTIYKASAGSGKTYQLTSDYLKLVFQPGNHFRHILAVTFTNKATAEMRERILAAIYQLSQGKHEAFAKMLTDLYGYTPEQIKQKASDILQDILHHYSFFNISTIDSFFQGIIKSFSKELGLSYGFDLELDMKGTISKAIEQLFDQFMNETEVNSWLSQYAYERMVEGSNWDIQRNLEAFAGNTFSEGFYDFGIDQMELLSDLNRFNQYKVKLDEIIQEFVRTVSQKASEIKKEIESAGLGVDDFFQKAKGPAGFAFKMASISADEIDIITNSYVLNAVDLAEKWTPSKTPKRDLIISLAESKFMPALKDLVMLINENSTDFFTAILIRKNINSYALSARIYKQLIDYCNDKNIFLLGLATPFLSKLIGNDDAPFIYEKTGNYLHHFMIDEFQDTSELNWRNFLPLLTNSQSQGWQSLIVGDVKQAIYRWRNGNWALLDHVVENQFRNFGTEVVDLPYNYRSTANIIAFNNWCFQSIHQFLSPGLLTEIEKGWLEPGHFEMFSRTFGHAQQQNPKDGDNKGGYVSVQFIEDEDRNKAASEIARRMIEQIDYLHTLGYKAGDMAVLVRKNSEGAYIAAKLMEAQLLNPAKEAQYRFVSNDSVFLGSNNSVHLVIAGLKYLLNPTDKLNRGQLVWFYFNRLYGQAKAVEMIEKLAIPGDEIFLNNFPLAFTELTQQYKYLSITALIHRLIVTLVNQSIASELPYLNSLEDEVYKFNQREGSNLQAFIDWWDEKGQTVPVALNDTRNAIRIMTIHKAKGLEFNVVFLPFAHWDINQRDTMLWCKTHQEPFNFINPVPVRYSQKMRFSHFKAEYYNEKFLSLTDNLNLLYVALTRAVQAMFVYSHHKPTKNEASDEVKNVKGLLLNLINQKHEESFIWDATQLQLSLGRLSGFQSKVTEPDQLEPKAAMSDVFHRASIKIKQHAAPFFENLDQEDNTKLNRGTLLHRIFEYIIYVDDVENAIEKVISEGLILRDEKPVWTQMVNQFIHQPGVNNWFDKQWQVLTEQSILIRNGEIKRPDRVLIGENEIKVIDYKFVRTKLPEHTEQVKEYISVIQQIENKPTKGYVWYALRGEITEV